FRAACAYADTQTESQWRHALEGTLKTEALLRQGAQAASWITSACVRVADECFRLGGGRALYETSPLQRRMRDLHAAAQHAGVHERIYGGAGKLALGNSSAAGVRIAHACKAKPGSDWLRARLGFRFDLLFHATRSSLRSPRSRRAVTRTMR